MRVRTAFVLGGLAVSAGTATLLVPVLTASAACSGVLLTELRMAECLSPTTRAIRRATAQPGVARFASPPPASQAQPGIDMPQGAKS
jgi:hypothetical protein